VFVVEALAAEWSAHAIDTHDDKAKVRECLIVAAGRREAARSTGADLRSRVDVVDDWVLLRCVKVGRLPEEAVERRLAVTRVHGDGCRRFPACGEQFGDVLMRQSRDQLARVVAK